jgi:hypothetical protein
MDLFWALQLLGSLITIHLSVYSSSIFLDRSFCLQTNEDVVLNTYKLSCRSVSYLHLLQKYDKYGFKNPSDTIMYGVISGKHLMDSENIKDEVYTFECVAGKLIDDGRNQTGDCIIDYYNQAIGGDLGNFLNPNKFEQTTCLFQKKENKLWRWIKNIKYYSFCIVYEFYVSVAFYNFLF